MRRSFKFRMAYHLDLAAMHLYNLLTLAAVIMAVIMLPALDGIVLGVAAALFWIVSNVERYFIYRPVLRSFSCVNPVIAILMDWTLTFRNIILRLRYIFSDKNDFITHKL